ncbi:methyltransferase, FxLD system [Actinomadura monticuli]|uniref:Protein-L-isoaspartate O-methyltransferase n=1 Tax=Actinomadura monticuli TaxID=3097367 RepID=A0ABV4Q6A2_9ACTN
MTDDSSPAARLRHELADELLAQGRIVSPAVDKAFRTVPREMFVPAGTPLDVVYSVDSPVITKTDEHGAHISSVSATYIQARMIEMAALAPGMAVLEIGSGGYNAALLAEVVGSDGHVVSVDIDAEITKRANDLLDVAGYGGRVTVVQADAQHPLPGFEPFDRILVTVGAWDVLPAWLDQLTAGGILVVPLRLNGVTRTIAFRRRGNHLVSVDVELAGFVPMRGEGAHTERTFLLPDRHGKHIKLQFDTEIPEPITGLDSVLATGPVSVWSGVTIPNGVSFADLHLWFAAFLPGFCRVGADPATDLASQLGRTWFPFGVVRDDAFAYLAVRPALNGGGVEFGATAYGSHGQAAGTALTEQVQAWDLHGRSSEPAFEFWPTGSRPVPPPGRSAVLTKQHGAVSISWPEAD